MGETVDVWNIFLHDKNIILEFFLEKRRMMIETIGKDFNLFL